MDKDALIRELRLECSKLRAALKDKENVRNNADEETKKVNADLRRQIGLLSNKIGERNREIKILNKKCGDQRKTLEELEAKLAATKSQATPVSSGASYQPMLTYQCLFKFQCSICTSSLEPNDDIKATRCGHIYHHQCLVPWLNS